MEVLEVIIPIIILIIISITIITIAIIVFNIVILIIILLLPLLLYYDYYLSLVQSSLRAAAVQHVLRAVVTEGSLRQGGGTGAGLQSTGGVLPILYVWVDR